MRLGIWILFAGVLLSFAPAHAADYIVIQTRSTQVGYYRQTSVSVYVVRGPTYASNTNYGKNNYGSNNYGNNNYGSNNYGSNNYGNNNYGNNNYGNRNYGSRNYGSNNYGNNIAGSNRSR